MPGCLSYVFVSVPHAPGGQWKEALAGSCRSWWCMQSPRHWRWSVGGESSVQTQDGDKATTASSACSRASADSLVPSFTPVHRAMPSAQPPLQAPLQATLHPSLPNAHKAAPHRGRTGTRYPAHVGSHFHKRRLDGGEHTRKHRARGGKRLLCAALGPHVLHLLPLLQCATVGAQLHATLRGMGVNKTQG